MAGEFGTATGVVIWFDRTTGVGKILGLSDGVPQAYFDSDGTIKAGGGQIILDEAGIRLLFSGGSGYDVDPYGSGPFGGPIENILQFEFSGGNTWFALSHADEDYLDVAADTSSGAGGYPTRWRWHKGGGYVFPKATAAPAVPDEGMVIYADGTTWNPGAGEGLYFYDGSQWLPFARPIRDGSASSTAEFSTTSTAFVDVLTLSVTTNSGKLLVGATAPRLWLNNSTDELAARLVVGSESDTFFRSVCNAMTPTATHARVFDLGSAGTYTVALQVAVTGGTGYVNKGGLAKTTIWYREL